MTLPTRLLSLSIAGLLLSFSPTATYAQNGETTKVLLRQEMLRLINVGTCEALNDATTLLDALVVLSKSSTGVSVNSASVEMLRTTLSNSKQQLGCTLSLATIPPSDVGGDSIVGGGGSVNYGQPDSLVLVYTPTGGGGKVHLTLPSEVYAWLFIEDSFRSTYRASLPSLQRINFDAWMQENNAILETLQAQVRAQNFTDQLLDGSFEVLDLEDLIKVKELQIPSVRSN